MPNLHRRSDMCEDSDHRCETWSAAGECDNNPIYMLANCKMACGECDVVGICSDKNEQCSGWAQFGECESNPQYMLENCKESCGECGGDTNEKFSTQLPVGPIGCEDTNASCESWAAEGECTANVEFMIENCPRSYGSC
ncbi:ShK domain-like protein [Nitzschia inconspicua]|uniref:ShK domain-like protein n=1 Tax=Nitzschia inconspicua TaxID=303405 RepID=A0A9K3KQH5_9STRA|nr:ShK domain-like protein [Nitzschia inconspicua]